MTACFWTDMVGVSEDCSDAPMYAGVSRAFDGFTITVFDSLVDWNAQTPGDASTLAIVAAKLWTPTGDGSSNCTWLRTVVAAHGETPGSETPTPDLLLLEPESFFDAGSEATYTGTGSLAVAWDGFNATITNEELWAFVSGANAGVVLLTLVNTATGQQYTGSGSISSCF